MEAKVQGIQGASGREVSAEIYLVNATMKILGKIKWFWHCRIVPGGRKFFKWFGLTNIVVISSFGLGLFAWMKVIPERDKLRLEVEQVRMAIEKKRLEIERHKLLIERDRAELDVKGKIDFECGPKNPSTSLCTVTNEGLLPWSEAKLACTLVQINDGKIEYLFRGKEVISTEGTLRIPAKSHIEIKSKTDLKNSTLPFVFAVSSLRAIQFVNSNKVPVELDSVFLLEVDPYTAKKEWGWTEMTEPFQTVTNEKDRVALQTLADSVKKKALER